MVIVMENAYWSHKKLESMQRYTPEPVKYAYNFITWEVETEEQ